MLDNTRCANCDRAIDGAGQHYCPACGQPTPAHRIDWHFLGHELEHGVWHVDRGIFFTLKQLMLRPGHFIRDYIEGRRARHVKPVPLLLMTAAILVLLAHYLLAGDVAGSSFTDGMEAAMSERSTDGSAETDVILQAFLWAKDWFNRHLALVTLLLLPLEAAAFKLAFRRFRQINYPEWLVISAFLTAQTFVIWALSVPLQRVWPDTQAWMLMLAMAYNVFSLIQYFHGYPRWKTLLRALLGFGMFVFVQWLFTVVAGIVVVVLVKSGYVHLPG